MPVVRDRARAASGSLLCLALLVGLPAPASGQQVGLGLERIAAGLDSPVYVIGVPGDPDTLLIVEQRGVIRRVFRGRLRGAAFLDIRNKVLSGGEQGLLSLAFSPRWPGDRTFFVNYTGTDGSTVVERYKAKRNLKRARKRSGRTVLTVAQPFENHNGGQLQFGPDGYLYIGMGDGGGGGDRANAGQDLGTLLGKLLRVNVSALPFTVPESNPTLPGVGQTAIWALGLRNPWRFSFDRTTGDLFIADVGQAAVEEVDFEAAGSAGGANYGWRIREGSSAFDSSLPAATTPLIDPIHEYTHATGQSITGGYVYRGSALPEIDGHYFFADFISRRIWSFTVRNGRARDVTEWTAMLTTESGGSLAVSSFGEDSEGELYLCNYFAGEVYRLVRAAE